MHRSGPAMLASAPPLPSPSPSAPPHPAAASPMRLGARPALPDRNVTSATIEDAYINFILYCNPSVPPDTDTSLLGETFRTPPKSGGKSFSTYTLFDLIQQLETRAIKTWAELALRLGVDPPDQEKGQSSQRIQQYAVRLKRWMHSMHVDAFFEYLMNNPHPYYLQIPSDTNPNSDMPRDGVPPEDDMALRALLPHVRPRRGRRKPDDDDGELGKSPAQKPRLSSPANDDFSAVRPDGLGPWSAHPDGRSGNLFAFPPGDARMNLQTPVGQLSGVRWANELGQTPLTAYPHSAVTPSTRQTFWADEPKSAITPSKSRSMGRRHGAKAVSSAWKGGGPGGSGKTRGRPPMNRNVVDGPFSTFPADSSRVFQSGPVASPQLTPGSTTPHGVVPTAEMTPVSSSMPPSMISPPPQLSQPQSGIPPPPPPSMLSQQDSAPLSAGLRPARPSRLSLQVPERVGGSVRLASPPPVVMINGQATAAAAMVDHTGISSGVGMGQTLGGAGVRDVTASVSATSIDLHNSNPAFTEYLPSDGFFMPKPLVQFEDPSDRTNKDEVDAFFMHEIITADWVDAQDRPVPPCTVDEAQAIVDTVTENLLKASSTKEAFLINLAALTGGKTLMTTTALRIKRVEEGEDYTRYMCSWELRFGDIRGQFSMKETVRHDRWKGKAQQRPRQREQSHQQYHQQDDSMNDGEGESVTTGRDEDAGGGRGGSVGGGRGGSRGSGRGMSTEEGEDAEYEEEEPGENTAEHWQKKYQELLGMVKQRDERLSGMTSKIMQSLRDPLRQPIDPGGGLGGGGGGGGPSR